MRKKVGLAFLLSLGIVACTTLGFSSWIIPAVDFSALTPVGETVQAVAYVKNSSGTQYFATIEGAVAKANANSGSQEVYVIPGISKEDTSKPNPIVIRNNVTVGSNVSLILPYDGETTEALQISGGTSSDYTAANRRNNLMTEVLMDDDCTLTINPGGKLIVGGELGYNQPFAGTVLGKFCQISLGQNAKIDCYGDMTVNGFIKPYCESYEAEESTRPRVILRSGASSRIPMQIYDFAGGTASLDNYNAGIFPFNIFDMPNVTTLFELDYGSTLKGITSFKFTLLGTTAWFKPNIELVSSSSSAVICLQHGDLSYDYQPASTYQLSGLTRGLSDIKSGSSSITTYFVNGGCTINNLNVALESDSGGIDFIIGLLGFSSISTEGLFVPFSYKWDINLTEGSTCTFPSNISTKFLPGSKFELDDNSIWNIEGKTAFYRDSYSFNNYPTTLDEAVVENGGTINVFGTLGAKIVGKNSGSVVNFQPNSHCSITVADGTGNITVDSVSDFSIAGSLALNRYFSAYGSTGTFTSVEHIDGEQIVYPYVPNDLQFVNVSIVRYDDYSSFNVSVNGSTYSYDDLPENLALVGGTDVSFEECNGVAYALYNGQYFTPDSNGAMVVPTSLDGEISVYGVGETSPSASQLSFSLNVSYTIGNKPSDLTYKVYVTPAGGGSDDKTLLGSPQISASGTNWGWWITYSYTLTVGENSQIRSGATITIEYPFGTINGVNGSGPVQQFNDGQYLVLNLDASNRNDISFTFTSS